jgi:hypothetical protein
MRALLIDEAGLRPDELCDALFEAAQRVDMRTLREYLGR